MREGSKQIEEKPGKVNAVENSYRIGTCQTRISDRSKFYSLTVQKVYNGLKTLQTIRARTNVMCFAHIDARRYVSHLIGPFSFFLRAQRENAFFPIVHYRYLTIYLPAVTSGRDLEFKLCTQASQPQSSLFDRFGQITSTFPQRQSKFVSFLYI